MREASRAWAPRLGPGEINKTLTNPDLQFMHGSQDYATPLSPTLNIISEN